MRNYIILNGNNSNTISGLLIQSLPPISKPLMRTAIEEIDGRDGDIVTNLGYSAYDKEVSIGLYGSYDVDEVIKYFNDNSKGQVTFSNEPDKYYNYEIINQIDFERLIRFKTATVTLHCQPFKYPTDETPVEINIQNITNEAEEMDLDNTADAPMTLALKGNTSQASDPTPDSPVDINVVSGDNTIEICGKNIANYTKWEQGNFYVSGSSINGNVASANVIRMIDFISVKPSTTYTFSCNTTIGQFGYVYKDTSNNLTGGFWDVSNNFVSFTTPANVNKVRLRIGNSSYQKTYGTDYNIQLEENNQATTYEAYTGNSQLISLGVNNLFDGVFRQGNHISTTTANRICSDNAIQSKSGNYYTLSTNLPNTYKWKIMNCTDNGTSTTVINDTNYTSSGSVSINCTTNGYLKVLIGKTDDSNITPSDVSSYHFQIEKGSKANSYSPYGTTPIELCSSSDGTKKDGLIYDLSTDKLYKYSEISKIVLDGSESGGLIVDSNKRITFSSNDIPELSNVFIDKTDSVVNLTPSLCNCFQPSFQNDLTPSNTKFAFSQWGTNKFIYFSAIVNSVTDFKTWLSTHNTIVYYVLATPTTIEIDNDKLKQQVKALYQNAKSYDPITHITQNANDKPFMLNATAVQKGTDTATVDNDGNIYSKPTLDIEGNGIVAIYLNGNQMFSVDLSNSSECIIDVTNLEAYDPETNELMNRQVTGDYSKFILPVGENQVKVSGNVTKTTISDYVRWL